MNSPGQKQNPSTDPEQWVPLYGNYLYRFALGRLRNAEQAENMVQETFLAALTARKNFSGRSTERTWLIGILKHKIIDHLRKLYRERPLADLQENEDAVNSFFDHVGQPQHFPSDWAFEPQEMLSNKEFWLTLRACLQKLPRLNQDAFLLREIEKMPTDLICKILNITPSNLWVIMHRSRSQLRQCLEIEWFEGQKGDR